MDSPVDRASQGRLYLRVIDVGRRMVVGSEVIYSYCFAKRGAGIVIGTGLFIVLPRSRDENGLNRRLKETL